MRVLLVSNARPARAWRLALRIAQEIAGAEICGIVQRPFRELPPIQQQIAAGDLGAGNQPGRPWSSATRRLRAAGAKAMHWLLWCVHGCPPGLRSTRAFTVETLARECSARGWRLREAVSFSDEGSVEFVRRAAPDLVLLLGQAACAPAPRALSRRGVVRILETSPWKGPAKTRTSMQVTLEHLASDLAERSSMVSLTLPLQPEDGPLGFSLKADLIEDDLLVQAAAALRSGGAAQAAE